jgi:hypothetical protein
MVYVSANQKAVSLNLQRYNMGTQYVPHGVGGTLTLMRLWRKTEPLENAFMIVGFEAEPSWWGLGFRVWGLGFSL